MRGTFGNMIAQIAAAYGLDVEDNLYQLLPFKVSRMVEMLKEDRNISFVEAIKFNIFVCNI